MQWQRELDEAWNIMPGTAVEPESPKKVIISAKGMTKIEFDELICLFSTGLELRGWRKDFSGYNLKGDLEVIFKLEE